MIVIADECPLIRIGLKSLIHHGTITDKVLEADNLDTLILLCQKQPIHMMLFGLNDYFDAFLDCMRHQKDAFNNIKILILENRLDYTTFKKVRSMNIHGYVLKNAAPEDIMDALYIVNRNKHYFDYDIFTKLDELNTSIDSRLTKREYEIYTLVSKGISNAQIAAKLYISPNTVKKHVSSILHKLHLEDRKQIILQRHKTIV